MAYEKIGNTDTYALSTGLRQYRFVRLNSSTGLQYPSGSTVGLAVLGVLISSGSTSSTAVNKVGTVQFDGIAKVEAAASTLAVGDVVSASSIGQAQPATNAGDFVVGRIVSGSSGAANRIVSVLLQPLGSTSIPT